MVKHKTAYNKHEQWSKDGIELNKLAQSAARKYLAAAAKRGFKLREAQLMLISAAAFETAMLVIERKHNTTIPRPTKTKEL
jgi:hypothetical protein